MNPLRHTVLLVDDDARLLAALQRALHEEPYELLAARTADAALWLLATRSVDVLVTDHRMPGMSGAEFLARVRAEYPAVVSIMLTGHADVATAMAAINTGEVYRFFTKPCDPTALAQAIRAALRTKSSTSGPRRAPQDEMVVYEVDDAPTDLDGLLREIQEELDAAEHGRGERPSARRV